MSSEETSCWCPSPGLKGTRVSRRGSRGGHTHSGTVPHSQRTEATRQQCADGPNVVNPQSGILILVHREDNSKACYNVDTPGRRYT